MMKDKTGGPAFDFCCITMRKKITRYGWNYDPCGYVYQKDLELYSYCPFCGTAIPEQREKSMLKHREEKERTDGEN